MAKKTSKKAATKKKVTKKTQSRPMIAVNESTDLHHANARLINPYTQNDAGDGLPADPRERRMFILLKAADNWLMAGGDFKVATWQASNRGWLGQ